MFGVRVGSGYAAVGADFDLPSSAQYLQNTTVGGIEYAAYALLNISGTDTALRTAVRSDSDSFNEFLEIRILIARDSNNQNDSIHPAFGTVRRTIFDDEFSPPEPELTVSRITVPDDVEMGQGITIGVELLNSGDQRVSSAPYRVEVFTNSNYSADSRIFTADLQSGTLIAPQSSFANISVPGSATAGLSNSTLFVRVLVDPSDLIDETNEGNNFRGATISTTTPVLPDFEINDVSLVGTDVLGGTATVRYRVDNTGDAAAPESYARTIVRDAAGVVIFDDTNLILPLAANTGRNSEESFVIPLSATSGSFTVMVSANSTGNAEVSFDNNDSSILETILVATRRRNLHAGVFCDRPWRAGVLDVGRFQPAKPGRAR